MSGSPIKTLTFGCRLNALESEVMRARAEAAGVGDAVLVNTCAVTAEAVRQARQAIRRARRDNPAARIVVSGCAAQIDPAAFAAMPEVDLVLGNAEKLTAAAYRDFGLGDTARVRVNDIMSVRETAGHLIEGMDAHSRAFVEVQNGCDHRCTFCIIPYGRGNSRSVPMGAVVDQIRQLVENGYREVVLTGVDITSYGGDLPGAPSLGRLVARSSGTCRSSSAFASPRSIRSRSTTALLDCDRRGGAADAASPSLAPARRRPDPQAHEAAAFAAPMRSASSTPCAGSVPTSCSAPT